MGTVTFVIYFIIIGVIISRLSKLVGSEMFKLFGIIFEFFQDMFEFFRKLFRKLGDIIKSIIR